MSDQFYLWLSSNWVEITGSILGILYVFFSIKQNIATWLLGLLTSLLYCYVFFVSKFYADMGLQVYYVWVSIYGWVLWAKGKQTQNGKQNLPVSCIDKSQLYKLTLISVALWLIIYFILKHLIFCVSSPKSEFTASAEIQNSFFDLNAIPSTCPKSLATPSFKIDLG